MFKKVLIAAAALSILAGCTRDISSNSYSSASVGEASLSYQGTVASVRKVTVKESEYKEGIIGGAAAGGMIGSGGGDPLAAIAGAVIGGVVGGYAQDKLATQEAYEYVVKLNNSQLLTVVQGLDAQFSVGQKVMVLQSHDGRSRVVADHTGLNEVQGKVNTPNVVKVR